jgi:drug/metabolite transporter (DMT)-like permease
MGSRLRSIKPALFLSSAAAAWGVATVISKRAVDELPPLVLLPVQLAVSVLVLLVLVWLLRRPVAWSPAMRRLAALGLLNPGAAYALSLLGLAHITASMSVLLWAAEPLLILLLAGLVLHDRIGWPVTLAMLVAMAGVLLIVVRSGVAGTAAGVLWTLAGVGACAVYTVICRKLLADDAALSVVLVQQAAALVLAVVLFTAAQVIRPQPVLGSVSLWGWVSAVVSGASYYAVAFGLYLAGLRRVPASVAAMFLMLIPVFGVAAGYLLLAERLSSRQWFGAGLVLAAVGAATLLRRRDTPDTATDRS